jgi:RNase P/RNase MRP subunit p29
MNPQHENDNPVVLLTGDTWHIVEHSRRSATGLCGQAIQERRAHARLKQVGEANVCRRCWQLFQADG